MKRLPLADQQTDAYQERHRFDTPARPINRLAAGGLLITAAGLLGLLFLGIRVYLAVRR